MYTKQIKVYTMILIFALSQQSLAESAASTVQISKESQQTPVQRGIVPQTTPTQSMNDASNKSKEKNQLVSQVAAIVGGAFIVKGVEKMGEFASSCTATAGAGCNYMLAAQGTMFFGLGVVALQQSSQSRSSSQNAAGTAGKTSSGMSWGNLGENIGTDPLADPTVRAMIDVDKVKAGIDQAKKMGIDGKNPVKINGKEYKASDFSSAESMAAAGLPKDMISSVAATAAKVEKEAIKRLGAQTATAGFDEGAAASHATTTASNFGGTNDNGTSLGYGRVARDPAAVNVAGLTKNFNGDPIGVSADSIFQMMTRRYKLKEKQNSFIDGASANLQK